MPWGTTPTPPGPGPTPPHDASGIEILSQPTSGVIGSSNSITFEALNAQGVPYFGGATVLIQFVGVEGKTFTVTTDAATGIGTFNFKNFDPGLNIIELEVIGIFPAFSDGFIVFAGFIPTSGVPTTDSTGQSANVSSLGQNALPATDVPGIWTSGTFNNAVPWMPVDGMINSLGGVTRIESLESGPLGLFQQLGRGGHGTLPPEELPPKSMEEDDTAMSETLLDLDEILDTIARAMNSKSGRAKPEAGRSQAGPAKQF